MSIETRFDVPLIARMASREKQIQQHYRPIIAVHKWFARRPGTLFRGLILAEFCDKPLAESFFAANDCSGRTVADPFMGGGTPLLERTVWAATYSAATSTPCPAGWFAKRSTKSTWTTTGAPPARSSRNSPPKSDRRTAPTVPRTATPTCR